MREFVDVHDAHCCKIHGCKYGDPDCTVVYGDNPGIVCEECESEPQITIVEWGDIVDVIAKPYYNSKEEKRWKFNKENAARGFAEILEYFNNCRVTVKTGV